MVTLIYMLGFGAKFPPSESTFWKMSAGDVLLANIYNMVIHLLDHDCAHAGFGPRRPEIFERQNPYDKRPRVCFTSFPARGPVLYNKRFGAAVRVEGERDTGRFSAAGEESPACRRPTSWMVETSGKSWQMIAAQYVHRLTRGLSG